MIGLWVLLLAAPPICPPNVGLDPRPEAPCWSAQRDRIYLPALHFTVRAGAWSLTPASRMAVQAAAKQILNGPPRRIAVHAHTHAPDRYSLRLGLRRARAVEAVLIAAGVPANRIECRDFGQDQPMFPPNGPENLKNRRIELHLRPLR